MTARRTEQVEQEIAHMAGDFLARERGVRALITVTHADVSPDLKSAIVFLTVLPESREKEALLFAKRSRSDFRRYIREKAPFRSAPIVDFEIDYGERNRQRVDELTRKKSA